MGQVLKAESETRAYVCRMGLANVKRANPEDDPNYQNPEDLYEFACHEGNYRMMEDALSGSRALKQPPGVK